MYSDFIGSPNIEPRAQLKKSLLNSLFGHFQNCRRPNISGDDRIVGGNKALEKLRPWQVLLDIPLPGGVFAHCGGSLINKYWILTAASCIHEVSHVIIYLGVHNTTKGTQSPNVQTRKSVKLIHHTGYNSLYLVKDIGLIKMDKPTAFNDYVSPICLPEKGDSFESNTKCYVTGWGKVDLAQLEHHEIQDEILQPVNINVMPESICAFTCSLIDDVIDGGIMCLDLHYDKRGPCFGDTGDPLSCIDPAKKSYVLAGIIATMGDFCLYRYIPSLATRVSEFIDWIVQHVSENT